MCQSSRHVLLGEQEVGYRGEDGDGPAEGGHEAGPPDVRHGEDVERAADGEVSLQREGQDGQHGGVTRSGNYSKQFSRVFCNASLTPQIKRIGFYKKVLRREMDIDASKPRAHLELLKEFDGN